MKVEHIVDKFTDYKGNERWFVMAAVSLRPSLGVLIEEDYQDIDNESKILSVGVSVCSPEDQFNEELGKKIATGKAVKHRKHALYTTDSGLINETMVKAILEQEASYFKVNPGRYIAGYDKDAAKYKKFQKVLKYVTELDQNAKTTYEYLTNCTKAELEKLIEAVEYSND